MPQYPADEEDTPCPVRPPNSRSGYHLSRGTQQLQTSFPLVALDGDDVDEEIDDLDYTRALPDDFHLFLNRAAKRRAVLHEPPRRMTGWASSQNQNQQRQSSQQRLSDQQQRRSDQQRQSDSNENIQVPEPNFHIDVISSLQPQQTIRAHGLHQQPRRMGIGMTRKIEAKNRRRVSMMLAARKSQAQNVIPQNQPEAPTIVPTIPASQSTHPEQAGRMATLGDKTRNVSNSQPKPKLEEKPIEKKSMFEKKPLFVPPKRGPLQVPLRSLHQPGVDVPRRANSGGKENLPPGRSSMLDNGEKRMERRTINGIAVPPAPKGMSSGNIGKLKMKPLDVPVPMQTNQPQRFARESLKRRSESMILDEEDLSFVSSGSIPSTAGPGNSSHAVSDKLRLLKRRKLGLQLPPTPPALSKEEEAELAPFSLSMDFLPPGASFHHLGDRRSRQELNPVLQEDLFRTGMYEDSWLLAQESSVSQLLNTILSDSFSPTLEPSDTTMRKDILRIYSSAPFSLLFKRLQASLLYGALSVPKEVLEKSSSAKLERIGVGLNGQGWGWAEDIAVRKKFLALFFECYDLSALIAGLEVVVGREMFPTPCKNAAERKRHAEVFLERYLVRCEDALVCPPLKDATRGRGGQPNTSHGDSEDWGSPAWSLRKSLLRSLMLILLMDKAKAQGALGRLRLFRKSSPHKSSASILYQLSRLLLPSVGDILRPLGHLNYLPETSQHPLEEYEYDISNLAVDMRDGVRFCRVVELLLYPQPVTGSTEATKSIPQKWPLSSNLKLPAFTKIHKLHNVSLAIAALESVSGNPGKVTAKDIVDGFREKTVGLLWGIVSRWGLELLMDWNEVKKEIRRLEYRLNCSSLSFKVSLNDEVEPTNHVQLLWKWASSIAKIYNLCVDNLTTSFSDGRVFGAIVEEYEQFFPANMKREKNAPLTEKLKALGCSSYFAGLFSDSQEHERVFDKDFVVAGLAYLCSRLFQWSVKERAATSIQRFYRTYAFRHMSHRRINLLILSHGCANLVNTRARIINAAVTIQRVYRQYLHVQISKLVKGMIKIQSRMRGVLARREAGVSRALTTTVQRRWRLIRETRFQARIGTAKQAIMGLQAVARGLLVRKRLEHQKLAVRTLEKWWWNHLVGTELRTDYLISRKAAVRIQGWWRNQIVLRAPRKELLDARRATMNVQTLIRGTLVRRSCQKQIRATRIIQEQFRAYQACLNTRLNFLEVRWAALTFQRLHRSAVRVRQQRSLFIALRTQAIVLQRHWLETTRRRKAATLIQRSWRGFAWLVRLRKVLGEVVVIQSAWRGYKVRRESNARIRIARRRVLKAAAVQVADDERLSGRMRRGFELMKTSAGYGRGITQLDLATRYSRECAVMVAENEAVIAVLLFGIEASIKQMQKSVASAVTRNLVLGINLLSNISQSSKAVKILVKPPLRATKRVAYGQPSQAANPKDIFTILLEVVESLKSAPANTPQSEIFLSVVDIFKRIAVNKNGRQRLIARKKWIERLVAITKMIKTDGERKAATRGGGNGKTELTKASALQMVMTTLQG